MTQLLLHPFRGSHAALSLALIAVIASCGGGGGTTAPAKVATVEVTPATNNKNIGETAQLTATAKDAGGATLAGRAVAWVSLTPAIASVTNAGLVTALTAGTATITAAIEGQTGSATVTIAPPNVATVTVAPPTLSIKEGLTGTLTATPKAADGSTVNGRTVTWTSGTVANATVAQTGIVTGVLAGTSVITATVDGKSSTSTVTVTVNPCLHGVTIALGATLNGTLDPATDCNQLYDDGSLADAYVLTLNAATTVQIDLVSTVFNAFLRLERGATRILEEENDDYSINSTNARITRPLSANSYIIWANSFIPAGAGAYSLTVKTAGTVVGEVRLERATASQILAMRAAGPRRR